MKKLIAGIFAGLTLAACTAQATTGPVIPEGMYPQVFVVTDVTATPDPTMERIGVETCEGFCYEFFSDTGDWLPGDLCSCIMFDMNTKEIVDDIILDARYAGIAPWYEEVFHHSVLEQFYNN